MELSNITVYTSITGEKDSVNEKQVIGNASFVAFLEKPLDSKTWKVKPAYDRFIDARRNSRAQKILAHKYVDSEYSIYIDGNMSLLKPPEELIDKHLKDYDIAVYRHPTRDCIYDESIACVERRLDDPEVIIDQMKSYENAGYARHKGLCECGVIFRRHTPKVEAFNNAWWAEYCVNSRRDQLSFMYVADKVGIRVNAIQDYFVIGEDKSIAIKQSGDLQMVNHSHFL